MAQSPGTAPLLRMQGISKSFPGVRALESVDFEVGAAEIHAFLGENGAVKSTLLKILSGAPQPDAGTIALRTAATVSGVVEDATGSPIVGATVGASSEASPTTT